VAVSVLRSGGIEMKRVMLLLLAVLASGCVQSGGSLGSIPVLAEQDVLTAQARLTYLCCSQDDSSPETNDDDKPMPAKCSCGGSGRSGDGIGPCECIANGRQCKCDPKCGSTNREAEPERIPIAKLLVVSGDSPLDRRPDQFVCDYCERWWAIERPKLEKSGWTFGPGDGTHAEKITFREFKERFGLEAGSLPAFWVTVDGELQPDSLIIGYTSADQISNHVNAYRNAQNRKTQLSTVRIITQFEKLTPTGKLTMENIGSGVVIESTPGRNVILTCAHCVDGSLRTDVEIFELKGSRKHKAKILKFDKKADLALLEIITDRPLPAVERYAGDVPSGVMLSSWGCDEGGTPKFRQTTVKELLIEDGIPIILTSGDPSLGQEQDPKHGRSGGGLFHDGKLVGIYSKADRKRKVGFIVRVNALDQLK